MRHTNFDTFNSLPVVMIMVMAISSCASNRQFRTSTHTNTHVETDIEEVRIEDETTITQSRAESSLLVEDHETITEDITIIEYSKPDSLGRQWVVKETRRHTEDHKDTNATSHEVQDASLKTSHTIEDNHRGVQVIDRTEKVEQSASKHTVQGCGNALGVIRWIAVLLIVLGLAFTVIKYRTYIVKVYKVIRLFF